MWFLSPCTQRSDSVLFCTSILFSSYFSPRFGTFDRVSKLEFANLVKSVHELVYVV
jgi:hypothetical protein